MRDLRHRRLVGPALLGVAALLAPLVPMQAPAAAAPTVTLTVAYWSGFNPGGIDVVPHWLDAAAAQLRKTHPNIQVVPDQITTSSEAEYYTKLDLLERSPSTAPDIVFEDSFLVGSDASAGFIRPLPQLTTWSQWRDFYPTMQSIVSWNGKPYGVMNSTDVQLVYYNKRDLEKAGLGTNWQPKSWAAILSAAKAVQAKVHGVIPIWVYTGSAMGEASSFRGFEIFLAGTNDRLYDYKTHKWEISGPGFTATWKFLAALRPYEEPESYWSSPTADATVDLSLMPQQQVAMVVDGDWVATAFVPNGLKPWPQFWSTYGTAGVPTEAGQAPHLTNQSGGWALSVPRYSAHPVLATQFIEIASGSKLLSVFDPSTGNLPPRADVLTQPAWIQAAAVNPTFNVASAQLPYTTYRPGLPKYVLISNVIAALTGEISTGSITPGQAAAQYASQVTQIAGPGNVERRST